MERWLQQLGEVVRGVLSSCVNDLLKLSQRYRIGWLFWPILSTIGLSDFHTIVLTLVITEFQTVGAGRSTSESVVSEARSGGRLVERGRLWWKNGGDEQICEVWRDGWGMTWRCPCSGVCVIQLNGNKGDTNYNTLCHRSWWRSIVVRTPVLAGELSRSCARLTAGRVTTLWVKRPLSVNQHGQLK